MKHPSTPTTHILPADEAPLLRQNVDRPRIGQSKILSVTMKVLLKVQYLNPFRELAKS